MPARVLVLALLLALAAGCVRAPAPATRGPLFFPPPPEKARLQYLGALSSPEDLPKARSPFADFVLGPQQDYDKIAKPIAAILVGQSLYICDTILNTVLVYNLADGSAHSLAGDRGNGKISQPNNIAADDQGRLYVADKVRGAVLVYGPDEQFITAWGRPQETHPTAVAAGKDVLYVCDTDQGRIEVWDRATGQFLRQIGSRGSAPGQFVMPTQLALDGQGDLYVTDTGNCRVQKLAPDGQVLLTFGGFGTAFGKFAWPKGMDVDAHGRIFVADSRFANVQVFSPRGKLLVFFGGPGPDNGNLDLPAGLHVCPWPSIPWLTERVTPGFDPEELVIVVSQKGEGFINFYAVARDAAEAP
ncbi:MAG: 6-bladed beta-propeller [Candidatus Sumerlaeota bacterium]|nr:6-bladed beta-propeller [Candidatus Sumerlaeota bacterium]